MSGSLSKFSPHAKLQSQKQQNDRQIIFQLCAEKVYGLLLVTSHRLDTYVHLPGYVFAFLCVTSVLDVVVAVMSMVPMRLHIFTNTSETMSSHIAVLSMK